jgi:hypothetical protein
MEYLFTEHIHRFSVWTAARAVQRGFTTTKKIQKAIEDSPLPSFLKNPISEEKAFDHWHKTTAKTLISKFEKGTECSYGQAAKIIAIFLKTAWVIRHPADDPVSAVIHPPIDRILLENLCRDAQFSNLKSIKSIAWTSFTSSEYWKVANEIRKSAGLFNWRLEKFWFPVDDVDLKSSIKPNKEYLLKDILPLLLELAERAKAHDEKTRMVKALERFSEQKAIWKKNGSGWGASLMNPGNWHNAKTKKPFLTEDEVRKLSNKAKQQ